MTLANLRVPSAKLLSSKWSPHQVPFQIAADIHSNPLHPLHARVRSEFLESSNPNDLRWKLSTNMSKKALKMEVTRRRLKRRWQEAFREAFRSRGLDFRGRIADPTKTRGLAKNGLSGTLDIHVYGGNGFDVPFKFLVKQADDTLAAIARNLSRRENDGDRGTVLSRDLDQRHAAQQG